MSRQQCVDWSKLPAAMESVVREGVENEKKSRISVPRPTVKHCLSFGVLDDCEFDSCEFLPYDRDLVGDDANNANPIHIEWNGPIDGPRLECLFRTHVYPRLKTSGTYEIRQLAEEYMEQIIASLLIKGWCVFNRVSKYYVVAFAIDGHRFEIFSKDRNKRVIDWGSQCPFPNGLVVHQITDPEYNENPVIRMVSEMNAVGYRVSGIVDGGCQGSLVTPKAAVGVHKSGVDPNHKHPVATNISVTSSRPWGIIDGDNKGPVSQEAKSDDDQNSSISAISCNAVIDEAKKAVWTGWKNTGRILITATVCWFNVPHSYDLSAVKSVIPNDIAPELTSSMDHLMDHVLHAHSLKSPTSKTFYVFYLDQTACRDNPDAPQIEIYRHEADTHKGHFRTTFDLYGLSDEQTAQLKIRFKKVGCYTASVKELPQGMSLAIPETYSTFPIERLPRSTSSK